MIDRGAWLEARRKGIGGSDAAAILGLSKYRSAVDVWEDKLGLVAERPQTAAMTWGLRLEDAIASAFVEETGIGLRRPGGIRRAKHVSDFPMIASLDRIGYDGRLVELKKKRTDADLSDDGPPEKRVPPDWYVQAQHYAEVMQAELVTFAILVAGTEFRTINIPRDPLFGADLRAEEGHFWREYVLAEQQPPVGPDDLAFLSRKYPLSIDEEIVATSELAMLVDAYVDIGDEISDAEQRRDEVKAKLMEAIGDRAKLVAPSATVSWKSHDRTSTGWKEYAGALEALIEKLRLPGEAGRFVDHYLSAGFGTTDLADVRSLYSQTSSVRPFRVDRKKEA